MPVLWTMGTWSLMCGLLWLPCKLMVGRLMCAVKKHTTIFLQYSICIELHYCGDQTVYEPQ